MAELRRLHACGKENRILRALLRPWCIGSLSVPTGEEQEAHNVDEATEIA